MSLFPLLFFICLLTLWNVSSQAQTPSYQPTGADILVQSLNASGMGLNPIREFTAEGTITYYWAGEAVQGSATILVRGHDQFRLDASLPTGPRSFAFNRRVGDRKMEDGNVTAIPLHNTLNASVLTFPYLAIAQALNDTSVAITYAGLVESGERRQHQVRVIRNFPRESDPDGTLSSLSRVDYFVDAETFLVSKTEDLTHPVETLTESYSHEVELEGYTAMSGVAVPTIVREKVGGQTTWEIRLSDITFNSNLSDEDFSLQ